MYVVIRRGSKKVSVVQRDIHDYLLADDLFKWCQEMLFVTNIWNTKSALQPSDRKEEGVTQGFF